MSDSKQLELFNNDSEYYDTGLKNSAGIYNPFSGIGTSRDPSENTHITSPDILTKNEIIWLFTASRIAKRLVFTYPFEASWFEISFTSQKYKKYDSLPDKCYEFFKNLKDSKGNITTLERKFREASIEARLYGACYIILGVNDNQSFDKPIDFENIISFDNIEIINKYSIHKYDPNNPNDNYFYLDEIPFSENGLDLFNNKYKSAKETESDLYVIKVRKGNKDEKIIIHSSRLLKFTGDWTPKDFPSRYRDLSILQSALDAFLAFLTSVRGASAVLNDHSVFTYGIDGLTAITRSKNFDLMQNKFLFMQMMKGLIRGIAYDRRNESVDFVNRNVSGYDKLMERLLDHLISESDLVRYKILGSSQDKGLGGEGRGTQERLDHCLNIKTWQNFNWHDHIDYCVKIAMAAKNGFTQGKNMGNYSIEFPTVFEMTPLERVELLDKFQEIGLKAIDKNILTEYEVRHSVHHSSKPIIIPTFTLNDDVSEIYELTLIENLKKKLNGTNSAVSENNISENNPDSSSDDDNDRDNSVNDNLDDSLEFNIDYVEKKGSYWYVISKTGTILGKYKTKSEAMKRLRQIEYFSNKDEVDKKETFDVNTTERKRVDRYLSRNAKIDDAYIDNILESLE